MCIIYICVNGIVYIWLLFFCFIKQKTAYEMRISDWSSDVCSSDLEANSAVAMAWSAGERFDQFGPVPVSRCGKFAATRAFEKPEGLEILLVREDEIGRASCRERVCQYV